MNVWTRNEFQCVTPEMWQLSPDLKGFHNRIHCQKMSSFNENNYKTDWGTPLSSEQVRMFRTCNVLEGAGGHSLYICSTASVPERVMFFWQKMQEHGCVLGQRVNYSTTILENFRRYTTFFSSFVWKRLLFGKICQKNSMFSPKKCKRKGIFFAYFARERVGVRRPCWHTRVQKSGENQRPSPPPE